MFERILSPRGLKIYLAFAIVMLGCILWLRFANSGIVAWVDQLQAEYLFSGSYYPEMTILIFLIPILFVSFAVGLSYDYLTKQGIFKHRENAHEFQKPASKLTVEYEATTQTDIISEVRAQYREQIYKLKLLGFEESGFYREVVPWFGLPKGLIGILGAFGVLANEVTRMGPNLTVNGFYILMVSRNHSAYASISNLGVRFSTNFIDETCVTSSTYKGIEFQDRNSKLYRFAVSNPIPAAWADHQQHIDRFRAEGKAVREELNMANYFSMLRRLNDYMLKHRTKITKSSRKESSFLSTAISTIISTIISMGILLGVVFVFTFFGDVISHRYASCWFVRNLRTNSLLLHFLRIPACMAISWLLARTQHNLLTVNGMGTQLYGNQPAQNSEGFISTKWLTVPWIPLLPVRSYLVILEDTDPFNKPIYRMQPLNEMNWFQIGGTFRKSIIGYGVLVLLLVGFILWAISECS